MDERTWNRWVSKWEWTASRVRELGGDADGPRILAPANPAVLSRFEHDSGLQVPQDYWAVVTRFSAGAELHWDFPKSVIPSGDPRPSGGGTGAGSLWDAREEIVTAEGMVKWSLNLEERSDLPPDHAACRSWVVLAGTPNGDTIAMDVARHPARILYLDHEIGYRPDQVRVIGHGFGDFVGRFTALACPGPEIWMLGRFLTAGGDLDPEGEAAKGWLDWLGGLPEKRWWQIWKRPIR